MCYHCIIFKEVRNLKLLLIRLIQECHLPYDTEQGCIVYRSGGVVVIYFVLHVSGFVRDEG
jgi:hypothetical protein